MYQDALRSQQSLVHATVRPRFVQSRQHLHPIRGVRGKKAANLRLSRSSIAAASTAAYKFSMVARRAASDAPIFTIASGCAIAVATARSAFR